MSANTSILSVPDYIENLCTPFVVIPSKPSQKWVPHNRDLFEHHPHPAKHCTQSVLIPQKPSKGERSDH